MPAVFKEEVERPRTKKELLKLLGAFGYYREYIPHFAHIVKPLTNLTGKHSPNVLPWENEQQCAFELLRGKMCSAHVLRIRWALALQEFETLSSDTPRVRAMLLPTGYLEPCEVARVVMFV